MILDTSALLAILLREPEAAPFARAIEDADSVCMSVAGYLEAAIFVDRHGDEVRRAMLDTFLEEFAIRLEPVTVQQIRLARQAFRHSAPSSGWAQLRLLHVC
jgi:ribonuclease VapC